MTWAVTEGFNWFNWFNQQSFGWFKMISSCFAKIDDWRLMEFALQLAQKDLTTRNMGLKQQTRASQPITLAVSTNFAQQTATGNAHNLRYSCIHSMPSTKVYKWLPSVIWELLVYPCHTLQSTTWQRTSPVFYTGKSSINGPFSRAMLVYQRVSQFCWIIRQLLLGTQLSFDCKWCACGHALL